jgi:hypothetical protein
LKFKFLTHYGSEDLCTLSQIKVHGTTVIASFQQEVKRSDTLVKDMLNQLRNDESVLGSIQDQVIDVVGHTTNLDIDTTTTAIEVNANETTSTQDSSESKVVVSEEEEDSSNSDSSKPEDDNSVSASIPDTQNRSLTDSDNTIDVDIDSDIDSNTSNDSTISNTVVEVNESSSSASVTDSATRICSDSDSSCEDSTHDENASVTSHSESNAPDISEIKAIPESDSVRGEPKSAILLDKMNEQSLLSVNIDTTSSVASSSELGEESTESTSSSMQSESRVNQPETVTVVVDRIDSRREVDDNGLSLNETVGEKEVLITTTTPETTSTTTHPGSIEMLSEVDGKRSDSSSDSSGAEEVPVIESTNPINKVSKAVTIVPHDQPGLKSLGALLFSAVQKLSKSRVTVEAPLKSLLPLPTGKRTLMPLLPKSRFLSYPSGSTTSTNNIGGSSSSGSSESNEGDTVIEVKEMPISETPDHITTTITDSVDQANTLQSTIEDEDENSMVTNSSSVDTNQIIDTNESTLLNQVAANSTLQTEIIVGRPASANATVTDIDSTDSSAIIPLNISKGTTFQESTDNLIDSTSTSSSFPTDTSDHTSDSDHTSGIIMTNSSSSQVVIDNNTTIDTTSSPSQVLTTTEIPPSINTTNTASKPSSTTASPDSTIATTATTSTTTTANNNINSAGAAAGFVPILPARKLPACLEALKFHEFKSKMEAKLSLTYREGRDAAANENAQHNENVFTQLMQKFKSLEMNHAIYELYAIQVIHIRI